MNTDHSTPAPVEPVITLSRPITFAGETRSTLTFNEPSAGQWQDLDGVDGIDADIRAIALTTGIPAAAIGGMGVRDFRAAAAAVGDLSAADALPDAAATEFTIALRKPVTLGETVTELKLREPTADEWKKWEHLAGTAADIVAIATVSGVRDVVVRQIGLRDMRTAAAWIGRFFADAPATGA